MGKFRKKPVVIEAWQLSRENGLELAAMCDGQWLSLVGRGDRGEDISHVLIQTLEGRMRADLGDWIIRGVRGEFYPCKPEIFDATYEPEWVPTLSTVSTGGACWRCGSCRRGDFANCKNRHYIAQMLSKGPSHDR